MNRGDMTDCNGCGRIVRVEGDAFERGRQAGAALGDGVRELLACQERADSAADGLTLHDWLPEARRFLPVIERLAPRVLAEMRGWAAGAGLPFDDILLLTCAYERHMAGKGAAHCTAFGVMTADGRVLCGQNNDEMPECWAEARCDRVVVHCQEDGLEAAIYTHPGIPAYMGMNSAGLCLTWMYIDNGQRQVGLPTNVLIRESLFHRDFDRALAWLASIPHAVPNAFLIAAPGTEPACIEAAPNRVVVRRGCVLAHANTVTEAALLEGRPLPPTCPRQARLAGLAAGVTTAEGAQAVLLDTVPVPTRGICNEHTLAAIVFAPDDQEMQIAFGPYPQGGYVRVRIGS